VRIINQLGEKMAAAMAEVVPDAEIIAVRGNERAPDGTTADADFTPVTVAAGANVPFNLYGRYARVRIVQSVADATKTKLYLQAKA